MWDNGGIWDGAREGQLLLRACNQCDAICHPPLPMCPDCQSIEWREKAALGRATLKSWLVSVRPDNQAEPSRIVVVVDLEEGVRFVSNLVNADLSELHEGMKLELCFEPSGDLVLPVFRPAKAAP